MSVYAPNGAKTITENWTNGTGAWTPYMVNNQGLPYPSGGPQLSTDGTFGYLARADATGNVRGGYWWNNAYSNNGRIQALFYGLNQVNGPTVDQIGLIGRIVPYNDGTGRYSAVVATRNIVLGAFAQWNISVWQFNKQGDNSQSVIPVQGSIAAPEQFQSPAIRAVMRYSNAGTWTNRYYVDNIYNYQVGQPVMASFTNDATFSNTAATLWTISAVVNGGTSYVQGGPASYGTSDYIEVTGASITAAAVNFTPEVGSIGVYLGTQQNVGFIPYNFMAPVNVQLTVIGLKAYLKVWLPQEPEPTLTDVRSSLTYDLTNSVGVQMPTGKGNWGIVANHLTQASTQIGPVSFTSFD